jgi:phospholipid/cholesterol/gamma-HCH transport system substrate-binding protein
MAEVDNALPPLPASRGKHREAWVGLFVILGVVSGLTTLFTLTSPAMFRGRYFVTALVSDAAGIRRGDPVILRGVNIGRVNRFAIGAQGVAVRLEILGEYTIPSDSTVELRQDSIMGTTVANVLPGASTVPLKEGQTLPGTTPEGLFKSMEALKERAKGVLEQANAALSKETVDDIHQGAGELKKLLEELRAVTSEQRVELKALSKSLRRSAEGVEGVANGEELKRAVKRLDSLSARLDETSASLSRSSASLETVLGRLERGEGTLGKLSKDETLYQNLNQTVDNLNKLVADIRLQPKKYLKLSLF